MKPQAISQHRSSDSTKSSKTKFCHPTQINPKFRYLLLPSDILRESGVRSIQERLKVYQVKTFTKKEIRNQYTDTYINRLMEEVEKKKRQSPSCPLLPGGVR